MHTDSRPGIALVTRPTRMRNLLHRWSTRGAAKFAILAAHRAQRAQTAESELRQVEEWAAAEFQDLEQEDALYEEVVRRLQSELNFGLPVQLVDREFLPNFDFSRFEVVVVVGQDGLVANAAKYVGAVPIVAVNPDPRRFDGVLLPFQVNQARGSVERVLKNRFRERSVTLAEVKLQDGQRLLAFSVLFFGAATQVSARYTLRTDSGCESQSSSGMIISTGAGSTGWLSSVLNMACGVAHSLGATVANRPKLDWEDRALLWTVREPFVSRMSRAELVFGRLEENSTLVVESNMAAGGVIFSDGVESDYLQFNNGTIAVVE
ncbi:MAG: NAD+ kinase [Planctomycetota bacterium]|nr:NAD+ kinase [Planctomycetota bacterium]